MRIDARSLTHEDVALILNDVAVAMERKEYEYPSSFSCEKFIQGVKFNLTQEGQDFVKALAKGLT